MNCEFENASDPDAAGRRKVCCKRCGFTSPAPTASPLERCFRNCDKPGLGDYVKYGLAAFGITQEGVAWVRGMFGGSGCGGCPERQEALNEAGKKIGL